MIMVWSLSLLVPVFVGWVESSRPTWDVAGGSRRLDPPYILVSGPPRLQVRQHGQHGLAQRLGGGARRLPAQRANLVDAQPHDRHVALPAAITAGVLVLHPSHR